MAIHEHDHENEHDHDEEDLEGPRHQGKEVQAHVQGQTQEEVEELVEALAGMSEDVGMENMGLDSFRQDPDGGFEAIFTAHNTNPGGLGADPDEGRPGWSEEEEEAYYREKGDKKAWENQYYENMKDSGFWTWDPKTNQYVQGIPYAWQETILRETAKKMAEGDFASFGTKAEAMKKALEWGVNSLEWKPVLKYNPKEQRWDVIMVPHLKSTGEVMLEAHQVEGQLGNMQSTIREQKRREAQEAALNPIQNKLEVSQGKYALGEMSAARLAQKRRKELEPAAHEFSKGQLRGALQKQGYQESLAPMEYDLARGDMDTLLAAQPLERERTLGSLRNELRAQPLEGQLETGSLESKLRLQPMQEEVARGALQSAATIRPLETKQAVSALGLGTERLERQRKQEAFEASKTGKVVGAAKGALKAMGEAPGLGHGMAIMANVLAKGRPTSTYTGDFYGGSSSGKMKGLRTPVPTPRNTPAAQALMPDRGIPAARALSSTSNLAGAALVPGTHTPTPVITEDNVRRGIVLPRMRLGLPRSRRSRSTSAEIQEIR